MLNQLRYKVTFKTPLKTLEGNHDFKEGMTGITGPNGKGKSMILEMVRFALHGNEALRGKSDDYEVLEASLDFELKGRQLRVFRSKSKATLKELVNSESVDLASGTKAVNLKIEELFGYSSDVFRMANICEQGKIEELGQMKPTERKRLVDETIGLSVLDDMTVFIDGKRKDLNTVIGAIESILTLPTEPQNPELPYDAPAYKVQMMELRKSRDSRNSLRDIANRTLVAPVPPEPVADSDKLGEYQGEQQRRAALLTEYQVLDREMKTIPVYKGIIVEKLHEREYEYDTLVERRRKAERIQAEIDVNERGLKKYNWTEPVMAPEEIAAYEDRHKLVDRFMQKQHLLKKNVPHDCPQCHHHWEDEDPRVKAEFDDVVENPGYGLVPTELQKAKLNKQAYDLGYPIKQHIEELRNELAPLMVEETVRLINEIEAQRQQYQSSQAARENEKRRTVLEKQLAKLSADFQGTTDWSERIKVIEKYRLDTAKFAIQDENYKLAQKEVARAEKGLKHYPEELDQKLEEVETNYVLALNYESNLANYLKAKESYDKALAQCIALKTDLESWTNARQAVVDLRAKVKGYLLPSLNTVASLLISQMTGGELSIINVNDAFDITVDGQRLETLSGAGKAVANLALRIGLGQVLTNRVFSVMMLDEIDASMDDDRASYVAQCMKNLTKTISQVIQVSHKSGLVADHHVRL